MYTIISESFQEVESLENAFKILGATKINREGWPTAYGGTGITLWVESVCPKKYIKQVLKATDAKLIGCGKI